MILRLLVLLLLLLFQPFNEGFDPIFECAILGR